MEITLDTSVQNLARSNEAKDLIAKINPGSWPKLISEKIKSVAKSADYILADSFSDAWNAARLEGTEKAVKELSKHALSPGARVILSGFGGLAVSFAAGYLAINALGYLRMWGEKQTNNGAFNTPDDVIVLGGLYSAAGAAVAVPALMTGASKLAEYIAEDAASEAVEQSLKKGFIRRSVSQAGKTCGFLHSKLFGGLQKVLPNGFKFLGSYKTLTLVLAAGSLLIDEAVKMMSGQ